MEVPQVLDALGLADGHDVLVLGRQELGLRRLRGQAEEDPERRGDG